QKPSHGSKPFRVRQKRAGVVSAVRHRAELDQPERNAVQARPEMPEQNWRAEESAHDERNGRQKRQEEDDRDRGANRIERPLPEPPVAPALALVGGVCSEPSIQIEQARSNDRRGKITRDSIA